MSRLYSYLQRCCFVALAISLPLEAYAQAPVRVNRYGQRMEALFVRMDANRDGRLDRQEVKDQRFLLRRLQRQDSRGYLLLEDLHFSGPSPSGRRLQKRFKLADLNRDGKLTPVEAKSLPWISRNFKTLDFNDDGGITLNELWSLQRALAPRHRY